MSAKRAVITLAAALAFSFGIAATAHATIVLSNSVAPGDSFTNSGTTNTGQAVGTTDWYYNNVRNNGVVGINDTYPRSGNGSVYMETKQGPAGSSSKADIEYLLNATANANGNFSPGAVIGQFSALSSMVYDWYRDSSSTNNNNQVPALRVLLFDQIAGAFGLVFEPVYNNLLGWVAPTNTWVSEIIGASTKLWSFGSIGFETDINGDGSSYDPLTAWQAAFPNALVVGFSSGVGSGWGPFKGAVDNIGWTIGTQPATSYNFEVPRKPNGVPEPASAALLAGGLLALVAARRRRSAS